jgi:hypothetical protein
VRLFKRRVTTKELLRGHLQRLGISAAWLPSARDAIRYCEERDYFQPVFSVAGPAPARSVIALMRLEPFVRGEIDWSVSPSESPFWVGSAGDLDDEPFTETTQRFVDLYWLGGSPSLGHDFEAALRQTTRRWRVRRPSPQPLLTERADTRAAAHPSRYRIRAERSSAGCPHLGFRSSSVASVSQARLGRLPSRERSSASSVAPMCLHIDAPCVLASHHVPRVIHRGDFPGRP